MDWFDEEGSKKIFNPPTSKNLPYLIWIRSSKGNGNGPQGCYPKSCAKILPHLQAQAHQLAGKEAGSQSWALSPNQENQLPPFALTPWLVNTSPLKKKEKRKDWNDHIKRRSLQTYNVQHESISYDNNRIMKKKTRVQPNREKNDCLYSKSSNLLLGVCKRA